MTVKNIGNAKAIFDNIILSGLGIHEVLNYTIADLKSAKKADQGFYGKQGAEMPVLRQAQNLDVIKIILVTYIMGTSATTNFVSFYCIVVFFVCQQELLLNEYIYDFFLFLTYEEVYKYGFRVRR